MRARALLATFQRMMPNQYAALALQAIREDFGGMLEYIPAPDSRKIAERLERDSKILALRSTGEPVTSLAERFNLDPSTVRKIIRAGISPN